jgi:hypothetical protein
MTTGATGQLGLALPVQGELSGTWGDTVNNGITQYTNIAIAGTLTLTGDGAVTLANTTGDATASNITSTLSGAGTVTAQFAIIKVTGTLTTAKIITAPSYSKTYLVVNAATGSTVSFIRSGQTPAVSIAVGESAYVYYNGTDYVKVSSSTNAGTVPIANGGTGQTTASAAFNALSPVTTTGDLIIGNGTNSATRLAIGTNGYLLTSNGTTASWAAAPAGGVTTFSAGTTGFTPSSGTSGAVTLAGTLATTNGGTGLTSFTSGGVAYASSTSALATGAGLIFSGTNLGLGLTPSAWNSSFKAFEMQSLSLMSDNAATTAFINQNAYYASGGWTYKNTGTATKLELGAGECRWYNAPSGTAGTTASFTQRMTLDSTGNLLIGSTTNTFAATGRVNLLVNGTTSSISGLQYGGGNSYYMQVDVNGAYLWNVGATAMIFGTNNTERMRVSSVGGFSVGTTADPGAGAIYATGNITAYYSSDIKFKENVRDIPDALATVNAIGGKLFDWTDDYIDSKGGADGYFVQKADFGVVAQDVQKVFPIAVRTREDGSLAVDYEKLGALAFAALVELTKRVEALEAK